jgi:hypothetical protein
MAAVRHQNSQVVSCCRRCKDSASLTSTAVSFFATYFDAAHRTITVSTGPGAEKNIDAELLAHTAGLETWLREEARGDASAVIPTRKVCRLHLGGRCKYGKDCKYIHLCSTLGESFLSATAMPIPPLDQPAPTNQPTPPTCAWRSKAPSAKTNVFYSAKTKMPEGNAFFERVKNTATNDFSRSSSVPGGASEISSVEDTPAPSYFTSERFVAPSSLPPPAAAAERSGSAMFPRSNGSSCLERSVALTGLCFDPALLWDSSEDIPSAKKDTFAASCEMLSATCSEAHSVRKRDRCAFY